LVAVMVAEPTAPTVTVPAAFTAADAALLES
jgi:hypothetical protein